ncbi:PucR family transcriptional regulator [Serinibacter arcticus]|uniref:PucR family transcriptional regulator n=1 Tax=Serinibacter arcticus TaxID=1655435 RepID=UPI0013049656|nr:PucR family transcriptional regulator [Serinibacter arcticus]
MQPTLGSLIAHRPLALRVIVDGDAEALTATVTWAHGTDLLDPTPFLEPGSVVLTTGTQLPDDEAAPHASRPDSTTGAYVARLVTAGVLALGHGSDVVRGAPPAALVRACREARLPLFEVPYATPFVAVASWVAEERTRAGRARADWGVRATRAVTSAAHRLDGLAASLAGVAEQTGTQIGVVEPDRVRAWGHDGRFLSPAALAAAPWPALREEATRLLRDGRRAATTLDVEGRHATCQTLGRAGELRGVLVRVGDAAPDAVETGVLATASALAGLSLEQDRRGLQARDQVASAVVALAVAGHADAVRTAARRLGTPLPPAPVRVLRVRGEAADLERARALLRPLPGFGALHEQEIVALVPAGAAAEVATALAGAPGATAGLSGAVAHPELPRAFREAGVAVTGADPGELRLFGDLAGRPLEWISMTPGARDVARALLAPLAADERVDLLAALRAWLTHGCQWDPAARSLGIHRHTLRALVDRAARLLGRDLATMDARAEIWWALRAVGPDGD